MHISYFDEMNESLVYYLISLHLLLHVQHAQYIVTINKDETALVYCYSSAENSTFTNRTCEKLPNNDQKRAHYTCLTRISYNEIPVTLVCGILNNSLNIQLQVISSVAPVDKYTTAYTNTTDMMCLVPQNKTEINAGHLLSVVWSRDSRRIHNSDTQFYKITRQPIWKMYKGKIFQCNGTRYIVNAVFQCLQLLPSGWPSFTGCTIYHTIGITMGVVLIFIAAYMVLCVGLCRVLSICRKKR